MTKVLMTPALNTVDIFKGKYNCKTPISHLTPDRKEFSVLLDTATFNDLYCQKSPNFVVFTIGLYKEKKHSASKHTA